MNKFKNLFSFNSLLLIFLILYIVFIYSGFRQNSWDVAENVASISSVFVSILILWVAYNSLEESKKQRELMNKPLVSAKISTLNPNDNMLYFIIENAGNGPAYNVSLKLDKDIKYNDTTLNQLELFNEIPVISPKEKITFFLDVAHNYVKSDNPNETKAYINYYQYPEGQGDENKIEKMVNINAMIKKDTLQLRSYTTKDIVKELEELKEILAIIYLDELGED